MGIDPRTVLYSDVFVCHEWRRRFVKGLIRSWVNGFEEACERKRKGEVIRKSRSDV